jgi:hypothetical protein
MTSLPLTQNPTDIVLLLTSEKNSEIPEILAKTNIDDIPKLQESEKAIQKSQTIPQLERDYRIKLLQQRFEQLSVIQNFQAFKEDYKDYKAHFSINGRGILIKIISPDGISWEKQTQTFVNFQASQEFHLTVNKILVKDTTELVQKPTLQLLTEKQQCWQLLKKLTQGERVLYKGRIGTYKGVQESDVPNAWVLFDDSHTTEPIHPLDLILDNLGETLDNFNKLSEGSENNESNPKISSNLNSNIIPFCPQTIKGQLSKEETEKILACINSNLSQLKTLTQFQKRSNHIIRHYLVLLDEGKGYEQLGFKNMTALLNSNLIQGSRSNLQKQWQAGRIERDCLGVAPGTIPEDHCRKLAALKAYPEKVKQAYVNAHQLAGDRQITAKLVQRAVQELAQSQGIELLPKLEKKSLDGKNQNIVIDNDFRQDILKQSAFSQNIFRQNILNPEDYNKVDLREFNKLLESHVEAFSQLNEMAKKCNLTPEILIVRGLIRFTSQSMKLSSLEVITKAIEVALTEIRIDIAA